MTETMADKIKAAAGNMPKASSDDMTGTVEVPREHPKGINSIHIMQEKAEFSVKASRKRWRWVSPIAAMLLLILAIVLGIYFGTNPGGYRNNGSFVPPSFSWWPMLILFLIAIPVAWRIHKYFWPDLRFIITPSRIKVGNKLYDRQHYGGMRIGYTIDSKESVGNSITDALAGDTSLGFVGLRLKYGRWGEDLDYMVNRYHAAEYIVWMNGVIEAVRKAEPVKEHDPAQGRKKVEF